MIMSMLTTLMKIQISMPEEKWPKIRDSTMFEWLLMVITESHIRIPGVEDQGMHQ